ncbi:MAG: AIR synthase-related protein, partial [Planctomycetota bacterium]|nr:AIR synthase-related protein [Planctomycetota bacterium]
LADPVTEEASIGSATPRGDALIEVHPLPGVMDPDAEPVELAIRTMLGVDARARTGRRYDLHGVDTAAARVIAERTFANPVIHAIHETPYHPESFPAGTPREMRIVEVPILDLDDEGLAKLSRSAHLFLSLDEMKAIQAEYRRLGRNPRDIELETLAQTWSEHCVHKTLKATIRYREEIDAGAGRGAPRLAMRNRPGHEVHEVGFVTIHNLLKSTVAAATRELMDDGLDWCLSVFVDNAGVIAFDDEHAVCFKVETHNHPSAIEPYGGAATGIGGVIRDVIGTGLAARPIASTDVFCVALPDRWKRNEAEEKNGTTEGTEDTEIRNELEGAGSSAPDVSSAARDQEVSYAAPPDPPSVSSVLQKDLPVGCLHPQRILRQTVAGVRDYGNRMGIPTLNGAVWFDDDYIGNVLVYCGCVGVMPRAMIAGAARPGDRIIIVGGRTGRDGIHGATFSSAELTDTHADEFSHAVQIGNPVTEKKMLDAILEARDHEDGCLYSAITDCGAGGFSSSVGEMGAELGAEVHLERAPLKYEGLTPTEIWISEAQERMTLAVPEENISKLRVICRRHDVEMCELGHFGTDGRDLILRHDGTEVGRLPMQFLHEGLPETMREARWSPPALPGGGTHEGSGLRLSVGDALLGLLAHPNIASKRWIIRQYDHEVQGRSVLKPLVGGEGEGPGDAAVITPVRNSMRGLAIANGLATGLKDDPYVMTLAAIDECVRNLVCVGADPARIALLDNFSWPSCTEERALGGLVRAAEACYDGAKAYRTPFISGKDSLNNQFTTEDGRTIRIPPTLLISGFGIVPDIGRCTTMDAKAAGDLLLIVGLTGEAMGGSHYRLLYGGDGPPEPPDSSGRLPLVDLERAPAAARAVHRAIACGAARAAHDCSEGGLLVAAAEMAFAGGAGLKLDLAALPTDGEPSPTAECFAETPGRYLLEVRRNDLNEIDEALDGVAYAIIGEFDDSSTLDLANTDLELDIEEMKQAWLGTLDW